MADTHESLDNQVAELVSVIRQSLVNRPRGVAICALTHVLGFLISQCFNTQGVWLVVRDEVEDWITSEDDSAEKRQSTN
jgi:hypothetical protein